jgi:ubiquinone/menaquinone biosynthesis C-methylase UbiE
VTQAAFDEEMVQKLEKLYRTRDARRRRRLVRETIAAAPGERLLDVGCGPGFYLAELIETVGPQGSLVGIDSSAPMLAVAAARCAGHDNIAFHEGNARSLPLTDGDFDAAFSVQVFEYVRDTGAALRELYRVLRPGGRVVVWDIDWATVSWHSARPEQMTRVLRAWDQHLAHPSLPRVLAPRLRGAGFAEVTMEAHVFASAEFDRETYGSGLIPVLADFVVGRDEITAEEADAWVREQEELGDQGEYYFSCTQFCFRAVKPS